MQTFLPYPSIHWSLAQLDDARLRKQKVECKQIVIALTGGYRDSWTNHPAVKMWQGHLGYHCFYAWLCCIFCELRGMNDFAGLKQFFHDYDFTPQKPWWWGSMIHHSHRANLYYKDPKFYSHFETSYFHEGYKPPYYWPIHSDEWTSNRGVVTVMRYVKPRKLKPLKVCIGDHGYYVLTLDRQGKAVGYLLQPKEGIKLEQHGMDLASSEIEVVKAGIKVVDRGGRKRRKSIRSPVLSREGRQVRATKYEHANYGH